MLTRLRGAKVYDPANGVNGRRRDVFLRDGRIAAPPENARAVDEIEQIKCYLTGERTGDDAYSITKYLVTDKHGRTRNIYNAKINIYRKQADPIFLGVRAADLTELEVVGTTSVTS